MVNEIDDYRHQVNDGGGDDGEQRKTKHGRPFQKPQTQSSSEKKLP